VGFGISGVTTPPVGLKLGKRINQIPAWSSAVKDGHWLMIMPATNIPPGTEIPSAFRLNFAEGTPFAGYEIVPTLHRLAEHTASIIQAFKTLCLGDKSRRPT